MKKILDYRVYLLISLISLFIGGLSNLFHQNMDSETFALIAFIFFTIAVVMVAFEELFSIRPTAAKKIKSLSRIWKK
jgi:hypothetical protein